MRQRRLIFQRLHETADPEAYERLKRLSEVGYDEVLNSVAFGTPEAVVERFTMFKEELGLTGFSLDMNPGGQIPYERVINSMRLLTEKVMPAFK